MPFEAHLSQEFFHSHENRMFEQLAYSVLLRWLQPRRQALGAWPRAKTGARRQVKLHEVPLGSLLGTGRWAAEIVRPDGVTVRVAHDVPVGWWEALLDRGAC